MKAMVLAAGLGTRLTPLTLDVPKPLIPLMNRPILDRILSNLYSVGVRDVVINTHHIPERIERDVPMFLRDGMSVSFSYEPDILGGAGGLKKVQDFFGDETFLLVNGDIYFDFDLREAIDAHKNMEAVATLVLKAGENTNKYGAVGVSESGEISMFPYGVSREGTSQVGVFCGIHILEPEIFDFITPNTFFCINQNVYPPMIHAGKKICGFFPTARYWKDLGTLAEYLQVHWDIMLGKAYVEEYQHVSEGVYLGNGSVVHKSVSLVPPVWVGEGTLIKGGGTVGPYVVLGRQNSIGNNVEISHSVIWDNVNLENGVKIHGSVLSHKVRVKENVSLEHGEVIREHMLLSV